MALVVFAVAGPATLALADSPPRLDVSESCDAAAKGAIAVGRDMKACLEDENAALAVLAKNWSQYNSLIKSQCVGNVTSGGPPSYVELLSCLEIMRDAKEIRETDTLVQSTASGAVVYEPGTDAAASERAPADNTPRRRRRRHF
jgi:hypothetical protein